MIFDDDLDSTWRKLVLKHTIKGACNFGEAAKELAHLIEERLRFDSIHSCGNDCQRPACVQGREQRARIYEECAQICDRLAKVTHPNEEQVGPGSCAAAIRARIK